MSLCALFTPGVFAQTGGTGVIEGNIINAETGAYIRNVRVDVIGTNLQAFTDDYGQFRLNNVPAGAVVLKVFYTGSKETEISLFVAAGQVLKQNLSMGGRTFRPVSADGVVQLDQFVVETNRDASAIAINEQRFASNLKTVQATDAYGDTMDGNVGEFLKNMPGLEVNYSSAEVSGVSIRGFSTSMTPVTIDGSRMASGASAGQSRAVELNTVSINNLSRIEVNKSGTPDQSAEAIGGSVNFVSKTAFERNKPEFTFRAMFNLADEYPLDFRKSPEPYEKDSYKMRPSFELSYVAPVTKNFGYSLNAMFNSQSYPQHNYKSDYATTGGASIANPALQNVQLFEQWRTTERKSLGTTIDWRPFPKDVLSFGASYNTVDKQTSGKRIQFNTGALANAAAFGPTFTNGPAGSGQLDYQTTAQAQPGTTVNLSLRHNHNGPLWTIDNRISYSRASAHIRDFAEGAFETVDYRMTRLTISYADIDDRGMPKNFIVKNAAGATVDPFSLSDKNIRQGQSRHKNAADVFKEAAVNARRHFEFTVPFSIKGGLSVLQQERDIDGPSRTWAFNGEDGRSNVADSTDDWVSRYNVYDSTGTIKIWNRDTTNWASNYEIYDLFQARPTLFAFNEAGFATSNANENYHIVETVSAAYLMGDAKFINNRLRVVGGVRFEKTQDKSQGRLVDPTRAYQKNAAGEVVLVNNRPVLLPEATTDAGRALLTNIARGTHTTRRYDGYYPSVNASFALTDNTVLRGSYSKTLARPQLSNILPNLSIALNPDGTETQRLTLNNTALKPWEANSFDASIEYYFQHAGVASVGFFYKDIQNYFGLVNSVATPDLLDQYGLSDNYLGYNVTTMYNLGPIILRGVELNYSQKLSFLPSIGRNFSVFANSTLMEASGFGYTVTDIGSAGITYASKKLKFSVKGTYTPQIKNDEPIAAGSPIYQYKMERLRTDVSLEYALSKRITAFINARDILRTTNTDERYAPSTPTYARFYQTYEYGAQFIVGLKGSFR